MQDKNQVSEITGYRIEAVDYCDNYDSHGEITTTAMENSCVRHRKDE